MTTLLKDGIFSQDNLVSETLASDLKMRYLTHLNTPLHFPRFTAFIAVFMPRAPIVLQVRYILPGDA